MHAASQGALGVQCRQDDLTVIRMLNKLNHEETVLQCVAERTFLAKLEGGCSAPVGIITTVTDDLISMQGVVLDLEGTQRIDDQFEISMIKDPNCPLLTQVHPAEKQLIYEHYVKADSSDEAARTSQNTTTTQAATKSLKHNLDESEGEEEAAAEDSADPSGADRTPKKRVKSSTADEKGDSATPTMPHLKQYSFIVDLNIDEHKLVKAELCGFHLATKLKENGAEALIIDAKAKVAAKN